MWGRSVSILLLVAVASVGCENGSDPIMASMTPGSSCLNPGSMICGMDNTGFSSVLLCSPQGTWVVYEVCATGTICVVSDNLPKCESNSVMNDVIEVRDVGIDFGQNIDAGNFLTDLAIQTDKGSGYDYGGDVGKDIAQYDMGQELVEHPDYGPDGNIDVASDQGGAEVVVDVNPTDYGVADFGPVDSGPIDNGPTLPFCGDGDCNGNENCGSCLKDCGCSNDFVCFENECCLPSCDRRQCGDDGCGDVCGYCDFGMQCNEMYGICESECNFPNGLPSTFGPVGAMSDALIPANATLAGQMCTDFTGDGKGNSGLTGLAGQINGSLQDAIQNGDVSLLLEMDGASGSMLEFEINGLFGVPQYSGSVGGNYEIDPYSYNADTCTPIMRITDARILSDSLESGPTMVRISLNMFMQDDTLPEMYLPIFDAGVFGQIDQYGTSGVEISEGIFSGIMLKKDLQKILDSLQTWCDTSPSGSMADICSYLSVAQTAMSLLFDLHRMDDGSYVLKSKDYPGNAASVCLSFATAKAKATGYSNPGEGVGSCSCSQGPGAARAMPLPNLMASVLLGLFLIGATRISLRRRTGR